MAFATGNAFVLLGEFNGSSTGIFLELIGTGGFSEVWMAKDAKADDAIVAVKIYAPDKGLGEYGAKQFRQEYGITHSLSHPHLMKMSYFDIADNSPYLIMPYYEQGSLATLLKKGQNCTEKQAALLMHLDW
jgi:serine/threonine-protein kinase